jgi:hypothetical protein
VRSHRALLLSLIAFGLLWARAPLSADQLVLKNGKKLTGTIVGFEHGMFRVKTEFGFALVKRDKVASIKISGGKQSAAESENSANSGSAESSKAASPAPATAPQEENGSAKTPSARAGSLREKTSSPLRPSLPHPLNEPLPKEIRQHVEGASYFNDTFQFAMFKPLEWKLLEDIRQETATGIVAMGSDDEHTLLIVDRQVWSGTPSLERDRIVLKLRKTYQEYRKLSEDRTEIDGLPAIQSLFSAVADGVEWHGVTAHIEKGDVVFGIIGLTSAETYQFQEAVFDKIIHSFHFFDQSQANEK